MIGSVTEASTVRPSQVPLYLLPEAGGLHVLAPIADIPFAPGAKATQLIRTAIDRHMDNGKARMRVGGLQSRSERGGTGAAGNGKDARYRTRQLFVIDGHMVIGAEFRLILRKLQTGDRGHAPVVENHDHPAHAVFDRVNQDLRVHDERAVAAECYPVRSEEH